MLDLATLDDPSEVLWLGQLRQLTRELLQDRARLARQIEELGERAEGMPYLSGRPLLRRRSSLTDYSWLMLDREHIWWIQTTQHHPNAETDRGPARAYRVQRTYQLETAPEILLGRLYRLQAEAESAGLRWADLVSSAVAG